MSKKHFTRSDIPYADRLLMAKCKNIQEHREDAARIALEVSCVALNDVEGMGLVRLNRYARHAQEMIDEYYHDDPDHAEHALGARLSEIGFLMENGHMYSIEEKGTGEAVRPEKAVAREIEAQQRLAMEADTTAERTGSWIPEPSMADVYYDYFKCSHCGRQIQVTRGRDVVKECPYCHCGTRMTEVSK